MNMAVQIWHSGLGLILAKICQNRKTISAEIQYREVNL
jgi:hypothetical protein